MHESKYKSLRVLVVGCGGIGGVIACQLLKSGVDVFIATTNDDVKHVWTETGPRLNRRPLGKKLAPTRVLSSALDATEPFDVVLIAVQPPQMEMVARSLTERLSESGRVVCLSNGLCEPHLAEILGNDRVVGAVVAWGARMLTPGEYVRTSKGGFLVGKLDGAPDDQLAGICALLTLVGPVELTANLRGARFSKLSINCAVSALGTIGAQRLGTLLRQKKARSLGIALIREAVTVAHADGVVLEPVIHVDIAKLVSHDPNRLLGKAAQHTLLMAVGARYRRLRSSMLSAIERGREPAVDYINGEISTLGRKLGIPTPVNDAAREIIWEISRGDLQAGPAALETLRMRAMNPST